MGARCARICRRKKKEEDESGSRVSRDSRVSASSEQAAKKRCCRCQHLHCCLRCLLGRKKEMHVRTRTWDDEFRLACALGKASTVEMLRHDLDEEDFEVDCETQHGYCGIHAAALHGHDTVVQLLLEWKSDINKQTEAGMTPLLYAACSGHTHVVEELMLHGAEEYHVVQSVNKELERSAYDLADQFDYEDMLSLFQQFKREGDHSVDSDLRNAGNASKKRKKSRSGASSRSRSSQGSSRSGSSSQSGTSGQTGSETSSKKEGRKASSATLASANPATRKASSATL
eukprot:CAMPEP_0169142346 /NCGR_PEP_ID=MMETSP1015-20121227/44893_1 /TAXON_ID=342587 /ORGANISM="Karlodinium micrum, Strain CCMP2283" /LENGTH=285 /DNA_ID=CAMNT_0009208991 /DNA_START=121 /DNA_END=975 /DNA_ORIENTATION=+